ncbi:MAG: hypothetical protein ABI639_15605 [Thermoanaerobaculia bacterium]
MRNYLLSAIRNRVKDEVRRASKGEVRNGARADQVDPGSSPLDEVIETEEALRYRAALLSLTEADRDLLVARVELGFRYEDLARVLGHPSAAAAREAARRAGLRLARAMGA